MHRAPIAFFAHRRPAHAAVALESLSLCDGAAESVLYIHCDGAAGDGDKEAVEEVRRVVRSRRWTGEVHVTEREENLGLAGSLIKGISEVVDRHGSVIVVEDDLLLNRHFLTYMNDALRTYEDAPRVMHVSGFMFRLKGEFPETFLLRFPNCWGWATWQRAWAAFCEDTGWLIEKVREKGVDGFTADGGLGSFRMLEDQHRGLLDSWAVRWYASIFLMDGLSLYPRFSLVENMGLDGTGVHCGMGTIRVEAAPRAIEVKKVLLREDPNILRAVLKARRPALAQRIRSTAHGLFGVVKKR